MNDSLLQSESIFVPLDTSMDIDTIASQSFLINSFETDVPHSVISKPKTPQKITMTQEQAFKLLHIAASIIQSKFKGYLQRKRYQSLLKENKAATKIQALWRGYRTRNLDVKIIKIKHDLLAKKFHEYILSQEEQRDMLINVMLELSRNLQELKMTNNPTTSVAEKPSPEPEASQNNNSDSRLTIDQITDIRTDTTVLDDSLEDVPENEFNDEYENTNCVPLETNSATNSVDKTPLERSTVPCPSNAESSLVENNITNSPSEKFSLVMNNVTNCSPEEALPEPNSPEKGPLDYITDSDDEIDTEDELPQVLRMRNQKPSNDRPPKELRTNDSGEKNVNDDSAVEKDTTTSPVELNNIVITISSSDDDD
uniref:Uncharacterized protein n=1 Tax=Clytia hemisphaerica TaxID=252671 RepID=A0A7M5WWV4_9CNID